MLNKFYQYGYLKQRYNNGGVIMNTERTAQERIKELRRKIHYAELARNTYKNINAILYETNSFYVDSLKKELNGLEYLKNP